MEDRVTLVTEVSEDAAEDYGRRCTAIGKERRNTADLQYAMSHPRFKAAHHELLDTLSREYVQMLPFLEHPPFATITIGTYRKVKELKRALTDAGNRISDYASDLMDHMPLVSAPETWDLYGVSNAELGLTQGGTVAQSFEALAKVGDVKLPAEAGPYLRLNSPDQPMGEWRLVYMDPISDRDGYPRVFYVVHDKDGLWLNGNGASPENFFSAGRVWVFGRKRPVPCA